MSNSTSQTLLQCPIRQAWISFRLVDEHGNGKPYAGLPYKVTDGHGFDYTAMLDGDGYAHVENVHGGSLVLSFPNDYVGNDQWYTGLLNREHFPIPLSALQVSAELSPTGPRRIDGTTYLAQERAAKEDAYFIRAEVSEFVASKGHLPTPDENWTTPSALRQNAGSAADQPGVALGCNRRHSSAPPPYSALGSIGHVFQNQLGRRIQPTQFNTASPYHLLCEEVPYSKRLEIMPYDPARYEKEAQEGWRNPEDVHFLHDTDNETDTNTQAFITHNDKIVLISVRGTQEFLADASRDADARQVPYEEGEGQAHRGFYKGFQAAKPFVERYLNAFYTGEQTLIICGHSLGGAIALLLTEWLRRKPTKPKVILYTFGAPRAGDATFAKAARPLTHHRIVNHNDPIPALPLPWMDAEWRLALPGAALVYSSPALGIALLLAGIVNLQGDPYEHHGEQWHFMPRKPGAGSETAILWQPGCAMIAEQTCARTIGEIGLDGDMPKRVALAGSQHSSDSGYARAALANLLRWTVSVEQRNGRLFTDAEVRDIYAQVLSTVQLLESWQARSFNEFRWELRRRGIMRFYGKTDLELRAIYADAVEQGERVRAEQSPALTRTQQRLLAQAERVVSLRSVFGEHAERPDLPELVAQWRAIEDNQNAERLASTPRNAGAVA